MVTEMGKREREMGREGEDWDRSMLIAGLEYCKFSRDERENEI